MSDSEVESGNHEHYNIEDEFDNIKFSIFIPRSKLDAVIADRDLLCIRYVFDCHCYSGNKRNTEFYYCKKAKKGITNRDLIQCLVDNGFDTQCNHVFLEGFDLNSEVQVTPWFGS
jgi:hypothetical protein